MFGEVNSLRSTSEYVLYKIAYNFSYYFFDQPQRKKFGHGIIKITPGKGMEKSCDFVIRACVNPVTHESFSETCTAEFVAMLDD